MNERTLKRRIRRQRRWCLLAIAGIGVFSFLTMEELSPARAPAQPVGHMSAAYDIKGMSVTADADSTKSSADEIPAAPSVTTSAVPEPASLMLLGPGILLLLRRRQRQG